MLDCSTLRKIYEEDNGEYICVEDDPFYYKYGDEKYSFCHYKFCRDFSVVIDLHTVTSKNAVMTQLTQQCKGVMLISNGLTDEV